MGSFDRYSNKAADAPFESVVFGADKTVLEVELNEMQQIQNEKMNALLSECGDCVLDRNGFMYNGSNLTVNTKIVKDGILLDTTGATVTCKNGDSIYIKLVESTYSFDSTIHSKGNSNGSVITNTVRDNRGLVETSKRKGYSYTVSTTDTTGMLLGIIEDNKFVCLAKDFFSGICRYKANTLSVPSRSGGTRVRNIYGKTTQNTYTGSNLFNKNNKAGTGLLLQDGSVVQDGGWSYYHVPVSGNKSYKLTGFSVNSQVYVHILDSSKNVISTVGSNVEALNNNGGVVSIPSNGRYLAISNLNSGLGTAMIVEGSDTLPYEPYVGLKSSPSPDYPQELVSTENPEITACGKNLAEYVRIINYKNSLILQARLEKGKTYTIGSNNWYKYASSSGNTVAVTLTAQSDIDGNIKIQDFGWASSERRVFTFTGETGTYYLAIWNNWGSQFNNVANDWIVQEGNIAQSEFYYEPYTKMTVNPQFTFKSIPVTSDGNVVIDGKQHIADTLEINEDGTGVYTQRIDKKVIDSTNSNLISMGTTGTDGYYRATLIGFLADVAVLPKSFDDIASIKSNISEICTAGNTYWCGVNGIEGMAVDTDGTVYIHYNGDLNSLDTSVWVSYVQNTPIEILYINKVPIVTKLTAEEVADILALRSFGEITNVYSDSDNLIVDCEISDHEDGAKSLLPISKIGWDKVANNLVTTEPGFVADARTVKELNDKMHTVDARDTSNPIVVGKFTTGDNVEYPIYRKTLYIEINNDSMVMFATFINKNVVNIGGYILVNDDCQVPIGVNDTFVSFTLGNKALIVGTNKENETVKAALVIIDYI